ncbi:telomere silencing protein [Colletotrichum truncatum]|uniref:Telomere silencing protein n=1 Tax=Colletotrichum truncatum TaxID=5467 RepID=A0ACC3ZCD9_COLTU|nr:telomere silencing protein [Colletotrichum truncatum]KAF6797753.1 telomere silencing protein [Colletotrichum truncatum]
MMTSSRPRADVGGSFASRRGHASQLSISDPSHHVTETIGTLYGDEDDYSSESRPTSFFGQAYSDETQKQAESDPSAQDPRGQVIRSTSDKTGLAVAPNGTPTLKKSHTLPTRSPSQRSVNFDNGPKSPPLSLRDVKNESSQFPLGNIENPNDIAQELSNLQALRRMSMDVGNNADPDMLPFSGLSLMAMPPIAPKGDDDENDPSRLLWVPAAVHPELAPTEFKNFLETRVNTIKRRSGESFISSDGSIDRSDSGGGLRRKKSMLSRQIDPLGTRGGDGYIDGAERLSRKSSLRQYSTPELDLGELVKDPSKVVQKLSKETQPESGAEDMPILPVAPGMGLRRSTRTTYRKNGSVRSGDRLPFSKRVASRHVHTDSSDSADTVPPLPTEVPKAPAHAPVASEPIAENFSRPNRSVRRQQKFSQDMGVSQAGSDGGSSEVEEPVSPTSTRSEQAQQHPARTSSASADARQSVPSIVESPTTEESVQRQQYPQRSSSSQHAGPQINTQSAVEEPPARSNLRPGSSHSVQSSHSMQSPTTPTMQQPPPQQQAKQQSNAPSHGLNDLSSHPSALPGSGANRTDTLTFIPTLPTEEKKSEEKRTEQKKLRKERDDDAASVSSTKSSGGWSKWLKGGSDDKDKKKKDEEKKKKNYGDKSQDNARLDVLQNSIEGVKGRESIVVDRDNVDNKLAEERKKESRKTEAKKEKEGGLFSGLFGGGKKKSEKESNNKKGHLRVSEEVPYRPLKPDVDYHWTRFPLLEERAIYRMAHIKLANPRRSLLSQVLLSNFMYNYLAIVQAMHPQMQVPQSPQQRRLEEERRRKEQEEQFLAQQQMQQAQESGDQEAMGQYNFEYHRVSSSKHVGHWRVHTDIQKGESQYGDHPHNEVDYVDDAQIYEYDHGGDMDQQGRDGYNGPDGYEPQPGKQYYHDQYGRDASDDSRRRDGRDDMW